VKNGSRKAVYAMAAIGLVLLVFAVALFAHVAFRFMFETR